MSFYTSPAHRQTTQIADRLIALFTLTTLMFTLTACSAKLEVGIGLGKNLNAALQRNHYANLVFRKYSESYNAAIELQAAIDSFLQSSTPQSLAAAKKAWLNARDPYGQTEAFRFYEGPIDFADAKTNTEGPEGRLNPWPLNEAYIDYVKGNPTSGIINNAKTPITTATLIAKNAVDDEADVTTGYHAIEFLLWGQDLDPKGPGARPVSDYQGDSPAVKRRKAYLKTVTDLVVADLKGLVEAWDPDSSDNYAAQWKKREPADALTDMLTGAATLAAFELASERIAVALDANDQEHEHSCFADNTVADLRNNVLSIILVYHGSTNPDKTHSNSIAQLAKATSPTLDAKIRTELKKAMELTNYKITFDQILATPKNSPERKQTEALIKALQTAGKLLVQLGRELRLKVVIAAE